MAGFPETRSYTESGHEAQMPFPVPSFPRDTPRGPGRTKDAANQIINLDNAETWGTKLRLHVREIN